MKTTLIGGFGLLLTALLLPLSSFAQEVQEESSPYIYARELTLYSQYLNEERDILVYLPPTYATSTKSYPVVYVTDGNSHIHHMSGLIHFLSDNQLMPDSILVAIPHMDRDSDLLPQALNPGNASGHADLFLSFLEFELIPYMNINYRTHPFKVLAGHSYGGLFVNYVMITRPNAFNAYVAADPSLWWDSQRMRRETITFFENHPAFEKSYYFNQSEIQGMGGIQFSEMLTEDAPTTFRWMFEHLPEETHGTIVHKSFYNGLEFVFQDFPMGQVTLNPSGGLFRAGQPVEVTMSYPGTGIIRYTTDGTDPNYNSTPYTGPVAVSEVSTIKASFFQSNNRISIPTEASYAEAVPFPAIAAADLPELRSGIAYEYFEGQWAALPDFSILYPSASGTANSISVRQWSGRDLFAVRFSGYINIASEGIYTFSLTSDDGSALYIDNTELILNDGLHAEEEQLGYVLLAAGYHRIEIRFFERGGDESLTLRYKVLGQSYFSSVPGNILFH